MIKRHWKLLVVLAMLCGIGTVGFAQAVIHSYTPLVIHDIEKLPPAPVALVFGAGVKRDGTPTDALHDRVLAGVELYKAGKVRKLVMTGDNGDRRYNEVKPMKALAIESGVPEGDIVLDYAGFRTYDSCYRARDVFGLGDVIAVSQDFHLPRILYICNRLRVRSIGYSANRRAYRDILVWEAREFLARFKAWYQVEITRPLPKYLGPKEKVF